MVRWWAAFFIFGMIFPPEAYDVWLVLAIAGAAGLLFCVSLSRWEGDVMNPAGSVRPNSPAEFITSPCVALTRAHVFCLIAAAGGIMLWQAAGLGREVHEACAIAPWATVGSFDSGRRDAPSSVPPPRRVFDRVSLPRVKERLARSLVDGRLPRPARALVAALVLDERSELRAPLRDAYSYLGITHFLALSGMHLAVIACALSALLAPVVAGARRRDAILLLLLGAYCSVVCFPPSLVRSYALIAAVTAIRACGFPCDLFGALAVGSFAVAAIDPAVPFDAGFQLSFAAVCGIAFVAAPLARRLDGRLPGGFIGAAIRAVAYPAIVTCAVQFFTMPLTVSLFGRSSLLSPIANILVSLPFTALLYGGVIYVFVPVPVVRDVLAPAIGLVCRFLDAVPAALAGRPHPGILAGEGDWALYGCGVVAVAHALGVTCRRRALFLSGGLLCVACAFARVGGAGEPKASPAMRPGTMELVGKGYRYLPEGGGILFVGSRFGEREARALVRALWKRGTREIECCVLAPSRLRRSHGWHLLVKRMHVARCLASPYLAGGDLFRASCERAGTVCIVVSAGSRAPVGALALEILGPSYPPGPGQVVSSLSARLVCRIGGTPSRAGERIDPDAPASRREARRALSHDIP